MYSKLLEERTADHRLVTTAYCEARLFWSSRWWVMAARPGGIVEDDPYRLTLSAQCWLIFAVVRIRTRVSVAPGFPGTFGACQRHGCLSAYRSSLMGAPLIQKRKKLRQDRRAFWPSGVLFLLLWGSSSGRHGGTALYSPRPFGHLRFAGYRFASVLAGRTDDTLRVPPSLPVAISCILGGPHRCCSVQTNGRVEACSRYGSTDQVNPWWWPSAADHHRD